MPSDDSSSVGQVACAVIVVVLVSAAVTVVLAIDVVSVLERTIAADAVRRGDERVAMGGRRARQFCWTANDPDVA
jgi:hypothetical protein